MRVELSHRCWQVPSSFSSGWRGAARRCKSFQRAERQSKHWLQMEGRVTIFPPLAFLTTGPQVFLLSHFTTLTMLLYFFRLCRTSSISSFKRGHVQPRLPHKGMAHFHDLLFPKGARTIHEDECGKRSWRQFHFLLLPARVGDSFIRYRISRYAPCFTRCHGSILISAGETELSIYLSTTFSCQCEKTCYRNGFSSEWELFT